MANMRSVLLLLLVALIALAAINSASAQRSKNNKNNNNQQRPKPGGQGMNPNKRPNQGQRPQKQRPNKPQQNKPNSKIFTTTLPNLGKIRGRTSLTDWTGRSIMQFFDIPYGKAERFQVSIFSDLHLFHLI